MTFNHCASVISHNLRLGCALARLIFNPQQHDFAECHNMQWFMLRLGLLPHCTALTHQCAAQLVPPYIGRTTEAHRKFHINKARKQGYLIDLCFKDYLACILSIKDGFIGEMT